MTIECYYSDCEFHSSQVNPDEGPFCYEESCRQSPANLQVFHELRKLRTEQKERDLALLDLLDGTTASDIRTLTGLPWSRCEEIVNIFDKSLSAE